MRKQNLRRHIFDQFTKERQKDLFDEKISFERKYLNIPNVIEASLSNTETSLSWKESIFPQSSGHQKLVLIALLLGLGQQLTGTEAILYYTPKILNECEDGETNCTSDNDIFLISLGVGFCKLFGELIAAVTSAPVFYILIS